jgi:hypothetical protein
MTALVLQITDAGRAAMVDAVGGGTRRCASRRRA